MEEVLPGAELLGLGDSVRELLAGRLGEERGDSRPQEGSHRQDEEGEGLVERGGVDDVRREEHSELAEDVGEGVALAAQLGGDDLEGDLRPGVHRVGDEEAPEHGHQGGEPAQLCWPFGNEKSVHALIDAFWIQESSTACNLTPILKYFPIV